jgi:hypothetical protein
MEGGGWGAMMSIFLKELIHHLRGFVGKCCLSCYTWYFRKNFILMIISRPSVIEINLDEFMLNLFITLLQLRNSFLSPI